ncbi:CGNR zinc finger domain-containing protein [Cohnella sp.]|uniref:CGNR zinc finger domain-containing protein n=1 Tax=Cohnella sp. TaxID=1883426 RepID=UPI0035615E7A
MERDLIGLGGAAWIDLANTYIFRDKQRTDLLQEPGFVHTWLDAHGWPAGEDEAGAATDQLAQLRELCVRALDELALEMRLSESTMSDLKKEAGRVSLEARIDGTTGIPVLTREGRSLMDRVRYGILDSLTETLGTYPPERIRQCEHKNCILHFVDTSKGGRRRWCSMDRCGNRQKAAEFYAKKKDKTGRG